MFGAGHVHPQCAVGERRTARDADCERRVRTERVDDEIETAMSPAVRGDDCRVLRIDLDARKLGRVHDLDAGGRYRVMQRAEERRAMNGERAPALAERRVAHIEHGAARGRHTPEDAIDRRTEAHEPLDHAELGQHTEPRRLQEQAGTHRPRGVEALEDAYLMSRPMQKECRSQPRGAAAADGDVGSLHGCLF